MDKPNKKPPKPVPPGSAASRDDLDLEIAKEQHKEFLLPSPKSAVPMNPFAESPAKSSSSNPFGDNTEVYDDETDDVEYQANRRGEPGVSANGEVNYSFSQQTRIASETQPTEFKRVKTNTAEAVRAQSVARGDKILASLASKKEANETRIRLAAENAVLHRNDSSSDISPLEEKSNNDNHQSYLQVAGSAKTADMKYFGDENFVYHKNRMSEPWLYTALVIHIIQFTILLVLGREVLPDAALAFLIILVIAVIILLLYSRKLVKKNRRRKSTTLFRKKIEMKAECTPDEEADSIPQRAIYCLAAAALLEGCALALYTVMMAGHDGLLNSIPDANFKGNKRQIILETLRFASITLLAFHRILRPSNRVDPMRTMLELEVVSVCWDALDGSTLYQLLSEGQLSEDYDTAARVMMVFWYLSVGFRMAFMMLSHLGPTDKLYGLVLSPPLTLAPQPTVDRTLQSLRLRSEVILVMGAAEFFAASLRISLWVNGHLINNSLQQEMAIKNVLFLASVYGAYSMWTSTKERNWNSPDIGFGLRYPSRNIQRRIYGWLFILTYLLQGALFSATLVRLSKDSKKWVVNLLFDFAVVTYFGAYCNTFHVQSADSATRCCIYPQKSYVVFPTRKALVLSIVMALNMYLGRIPALYYTYNELFSKGETFTGWLSYDNVLLIVAMSVLPIAFAAMYLSLSFMLFRKEFTACPGNYNGIHDPTISMVATSTMIEGSLDVLSCATLMQLASIGLPASVNGAIVLFALLELVNACQSFALQVLLSGGHDDTPLDLVKWKAYLRVARGIIDFGAFVLRIVLWVQYGSVSSVFLIKNLYNLLHTAAQIERWSGVWRYPKYTLFTEFVPPADWYGMSKEEWRAATSNTLVLQARAGRTV